ncbi:MAG: OmpA family protein [Acidobacteria bacterium]|nr:OmpA family protein [Acidobacteriota bacterium]
MSEAKPKKILGLILTWLIVALVLAVAYKYFVKPSQEDKIEELTSAQSQYEDEVTINLDAFSGYCVLRSEEFKDELKKQKIRVNLNDDNANYLERMKQLQSGKCQFAVFTVDSDILSSVAIDEFPGTIIFIIDESKGADAVVAYKNAMPNLNSLDDPAARIILTPNSPSEFMARIIRANFSLSELPAKYIVEADGSGAVLEMFQKAQKAEKRAYIMWEPDVSRAMENPEAHILLDSSKIKGYIVDVMIVQRRYLLDNPEMVRKIMEAYFRAAWVYKDDMESIVIEDAKKTGGKITDEQAKKIVEGIQWKNTVENYAHFGLLDTEKMEGLDNLEDMIERITDVLVQTDAIKTDPLVGKYNTLFFPGILSDMQKDRFHPGRRMNIIDESNISDTEQVRGVKELPKLNDKDWDKLVPVGQMRINEISFGRGKATIGIQSKRDLKKLAKQLKAWPDYYLVVVGRARKEGDLDLNRKLAQQRAEIVTEFLIKEGGIKPHRIKAKVAKIFNRGGEGQSVSFVVSESPY